jgi:hypothetical protein
LAVAFAPALSLSDTSSISEAMVPYIYYVKLFKGLLTKFGFMFPLRIQSSPFQCLSWLTKGAFHLDNLAAGLTSKCYFR